MPTTRSNQTAEKNTAEKKGAQDNRTARVRSFIAFHRCAHLATISVSQHGYPFGSIVHYDVDPEGGLIIFISRIAEHHRNLLQDPRASLFIQEYVGIPDPLPFARATALGRLVPVAEEHREVVLAAYFARFPDSPERAVAHDFDLFRMSPERVRWIGGFGDIRWIEGEAYAAATHDPVSYVGMPMIDHLNFDHQDALREIASSVLPTETEKRVTAVAISSRSFSLALVSEHAHRLIEVFFPEPVTPEAVRSAFIGLLKRCREGSPPSFQVR